MSLTLEIKMVADTLALGESVRMQCPSPTCAGSSASFKISRSDSGTVRYVCFRDGCSLGGSLGIGRGKGTPSPINHYPTHLLSDLRSSHYSMFYDKYEIYPCELQRNGVCYNNTRQTIVFPLYNIRGQTVGYVDRDFHGKRKSKSLTYWHRNDIPKLYYPLPPSLSSRDRGVIVTEDPVSAIKAARYLSSVSLLGTSFLSDQAVELRNSYSLLIMCLDPDAQVTALMHKHKWKGIFSYWINLKLRKDIKDTQAEQVENSITSLSPYVN